MGLSYLFFPGCSYETAAGYRESTESVCRAVEVELNEIPGWNCCGASAVFSLDRTQGAWLVARVGALAKGVGSLEIVSGCNGCISAMKKGKKLLQKDQELLERVNQRLKEENLGLDLEDLNKLKVRHLLEIFVQDIPGQSWKKGSSEKKFKVAPYYGCLFSRPDLDLDDTEHPTLLDNFIRLLGVDLVEHSLGTACCGASHSLPHKAAARILVERIIRGMQVKNADLAATICPLCQFNLDSLQSGLDLPSMPILYFTQVAGLAMGLPVSSLGLDKLLTPYKDK
jgi:heterodisulfide reductase subunit B2